MARISRHMAKRPPRVIRRSRWFIYSDVFLLLTSILQSLPLKERWLGYKHLAYVITLRPPTTKFALYSFTDMTLCLTAAPTSIHNKLDGRKSISDEPGTHIYRFKHRSRSRTVDWAWKIWLERLSPVRFLISDIYAGNIWAEKSLPF